MIRGVCGGGGGGSLHPHRCKACKDAVALKPNCVKACRSWGDRGVGVQRTWMPWSHGGGKEVHSAGNVIEAVEGWRAVGISPWCQGIDWNQLWVNGQGGASCRCQSTVATIGAMSRQWPPPPPPPRAQWVRAQRSDPAGVQSVTCQHFAGRVLL